MMQTQFCSLVPNKQLFFGTDNGCYTKVLKYIMRAPRETGMELMRGRGSFQSGDNAERRQLDHERRRQRHFSLRKLRDRMRKGARDSLV